MIEPLHLFTSAGTLSPQTLDRVYSFLDWDGWSGERVVLRPDSTIPAARLYADHLREDGVAKLCYSQDVFRFTDDGSSREEWQCGVELIGDTGVSGDVELVLLALEVLKPLNVHDITVRVSHAGLVRSVLAQAGLSPEEQGAAYDRLLDGDMTVVDVVEARLPQLNAPLRMLFDVEGAGSNYVANLRGALVDAIPSLAQPLNDLAFVATALEARGVSPRIQAVLARRFEYYSGLVLRIDSGGERVVGGGRYDELIGLVGDRAVPASGFALYMAPLVATPLAESDTARLSNICVEPAGDDPLLLARAYETAEQLRAAGVPVETLATGGTHDHDTVVCSERSFDLISSGAGTTFERLDDLVRALVGPK